MTFFKLLHLAIQVLALVRSLSHSITPFCLRVQGCTVEKLKRSFKLIWLVDLVLSYLEKWSTAAKNMSASGATIILHRTMRIMMYFDTYLFLSRNITMNLRHIVKRWALARAWRVLGIADTWRWHDTSRHGAWALSTIAKGKNLELLKHSCYETQNLVQVLCFHYSSFLALLLVCPERGTPRLRKL